MKRNHLVSSLQNVQTYVRTGKHDEVNQITKYAALQRELQNPVMALALRSAYPLHRENFCQLLPHYNLLYDFP
jgi:hypothetical protein